MENPQSLRSEERTELRREIIIHAPADQIWEILTAFSEYPAWNPFIRNIRGDITEGSRITASLRPQGGFGMTIHPVLRHVDPPRELRWAGSLLVHGLFDGEHIFEIRPVDAETTRFIQRELFSGILLPLLWPALQWNTAPAFDAMNAALKERAERGRV